MKNLGKILFTLLFLQNNIYALVVASVDAKTVELGDMVTLSIKLEGDDIQRPNIFSICGENVISTSSNTSIAYVNGDYKKHYILSYKFIPTVMCTIEPIEISIADKIEKTLPIEIKVQKALQTKDSIFSLEMQSNKKEVYVGEPFELTVLFRQKKSAQVLDNKFTQPSFKGFWLKGEPKQEVQEDGAFSITKIIYTLSPQRVGQLNISSANIKIARRENTRNYLGGFFPEIKWKTIYSNALDITSKPLPNDVHLVGDFSIKASVNKTELNPNEAVNLLITLSGKGNLEDVKSFKPYLNGVSIFDEKISIKQDVLTQKITFVGDSSFTIPAFALKVFNTQTQEVKIITTKPIHITINNAKQKEELIIKREEKVISVPVMETVTKELDKFYLIGAVLFGIFLGILIMLVKPFIIFKRKKKVNLKDTKILLVKLLPFKENPEVKEIIDILENNLYADAKTKVDKKALKEILKRYEIH